MQMNTMNRSLHRSCNLDAQRTEITFAADYLDLPLRQTEENLEEFWKLRLLSFWLNLKNTNSLTSRIRDVLKSQIGEEMPTLNDVASMLYLSPQTLRRRLAAEGKSYQGVKDALRRDAAIHLLLNPNLTLEDVAHNKLAEVNSVPSTVHLKNGQVSHRDYTVNWLVINFINW